MNNAGIAVAAPLEFLPPVELRRQLEVNVVGQHAVTQALLLLLRRGPGRIVNLGSIGDRIVAPMTGPYHVSKFALRAWSDTLRLELSPWGIDVVLVEPGAVATPIWETSIAAAERLQQTLPSNVEQLYGRAIDAARTNALRNAARGMPPDQVATVVARALTVRRPRARYLVGTDARIAAIVARLPDRLRDRLVLRQSGGPARDRAGRPPQRSPTRAPLIAAEPHCRVPPSREYPQPPAAAGCRPYDPPTRPITPRAVEPGTP